MSDKQTDYASLVAKWGELNRQAVEAGNALWKFMDDHADRDIPKPYEICGAEDSWHPRMEETDPAYDEDDLVPSCQCQLPKNHRDLDYRNHLEMRDGKVWGAWS